MANHDKREEVPPQEPPEVASGPMSVGWMKAIERRYQITKEDIETYPYVWASYGIVYGGLGLWLAYRWRKLRQLEDRVRILQEKMRQRAKEAEAAKSAAKVGSGSNSTASPAKSVSPAKSTLTNPTKPAGKVSS